MVRRLDGLAASHLVSVREASRRCGIPRRTLYEWVEKEKVWSIRIGDRIMLHVDDVAAWEYGMTKAKGA